MEPLVYIMAIMGCGDDGMACQRARVEPVIYRSVAECQAAMTVALERGTDLMFPVVQAACEARGMRTAEGEVRDARAG